MVGAQLKKRLAETSAWLGAGAMAVSLTLCLTVLLFVLKGARPLILDPGQLQVTEGVGASDGSGMSVRELGSNGVAVIQGSIPALDSSAYAILSIEARGMTTEQRPRLIWSTAETVGRIREVPIDVDAAGIGKIDLSALPAWSGHIVALGVVVGGPLSRPVVIRHIRLEAPPGVGSALRVATGEWMCRENWTGRSINLIYGGSRDAFFHPTVIVALFVVLACLAFALLPASWCGRGSLTPYAMFFLAGWLVLDLRWQWDLWQRLEQTKERYAGLSAQAKELAGEDGALVRALRDLRSQIASGPQRIFLIGGEPNGYTAGRVRYHLSAYDTSVPLSGLPEPHRLRSGDYLLIIPPLERVDYDPFANRLTIAGRSLLVDFVSGASGDLALFRVRGGA